MGLSFQRFHRHCEVRSTAAIQSLSGAAGLTGSPRPLRGFGERRVTA
jgi:hypothetical protein